ncbi:hypothetical protein EON83_19405 [bacterium]|nr:MAG: hypothetical protein EON83_19405 [bacterium]
MLQRPQKKDTFDKGQTRQRPDDTPHLDHSALDALTGHKNESPLGHLNRDDFDRDLRQGETPTTNSSLDTDRLIRAYDDKELVTNLQDFNSDELKKILIVPRGTKLQQGAKYIDLNDPSRAEITASGANPLTPHLEVLENQRLVPKSEIDYQLWDKLTGKAERVTTA